MSTPVLRCVNISKSYKKGKTVLSGFNCNFQPGKIIGLLGPNGCGKSTLMKLITGLLTPDGGQILIAGEPRSEATSALVAYLPERTYFSSWMRVEQLVKFFSDFYSDFDKDRAYSLLSDLNISKSARLKTLSKGTKEKVQLIMVMSRRARLYLLDEPIAGVDPAARDYILKTILKNYDPNAAVVITTHLIRDIEPVLDQFVFMDYGGVIRMAGDAEAERQRTGKTLNELFLEVFGC